MIALMMPTMALMNPKPRTLVLEDDRVCTLLFRVFASTFSGDMIYQALGLSV